MSNYFSRLDLAMPLYLLDLRETITSSTRHHQILTHTNLAFPSTIQTWLIMKIESGILWQILLCILVLVNQLINL